MLDIRTSLLLDLKTNMDLLNVSGIDVAPSEKLNDDSTSGWIAMDYAKHIKMILWTCRHFNRILDKKLSSVSTTHVKHQNSKVCTACLNLFNLEVPKNLKDKQKAVEDHRLSMEEHTDELANVKVLPIIFHSFKLVAQLMTSNETNSNNCKIHVKQFLNKLHGIDLLIKNDEIKNNKPTWLYQYNNMNILTYYRILNGMVHYDTYEKVIIMVKTHSDSKT